jgi:hypothetical protein
VGDCRLCGWCAHLSLGLMPFAGYGAGAFSRYSGVI